MNGLAVCGILAGILYFILYNWTVIFFCFASTSVYFILSWYLIPSSASSFNRARKKIMISTWRDPIRPTILGMFSIRIGKALNFIEKASKKTGKKINLTVLVMKAAAQVLKDFPDGNGRVVFGNYFPYKTVDGSCLITTKKGETHTINIKNIENKSLSTLSEEISAKIESLSKSKLIKNFDENKQILKKLPTCITGILLEIYSFIAVSIGINVSSLGIKANPYGVFLVSNVGMYDVDTAFVPLIPHTKCPFISTILSVNDEPVVENSEVKVEKILKISTALDHRFMDGFRAAKIQAGVKKILENPEEFLVIE